MEDFDTIQESVYTRTLNRSLYEIICLKVSLILLKIHI